MFCCVSLCLVEFFSCGVNITSEAHAKRADMRNIAVECCMQYQNFNKFYDVIRQVKHSTAQQRPALGSR